MCGIAGIIMRNGAVPDPKCLQHFADALAHRGPDGTGRHLSGPVALFQNRLAIIDLSTGDQPIYDDRGTALVANGEIYNYVETKQANPAFPYRTSSDCETILALYRRDGIDFTPALRGMYAFALHDPATDQVVLGRDPFGIKPLYYVETADYFAFASEAQALVNAGLATRQLNPKSVEELLQLQFTCGVPTIFSEIKRVAPGETLILRGGRIAERRSVRALPSGAPEKISEAEALERLDHALNDSVTVHQRSDVPYGLFLSGGIDSTTLLALMERLNDTPVVAFTAGFSDGNVHDERDHARAMASLAGATHHEVDFTEADFWSSLPSVAAAMDDPAADYAILPTFKLAREAASSLKVILSGEGGDEIFGGYGRYRSVLRPWWLGGRAIRHRGIFQGLGILHEESDGWRDGIAVSNALSDAQGHSRLQAAQAADATDWLANDLLTKLDRCLMAHSLEGRTPFLDPVVAEAAFRLPDTLKVHKGLGKWILRRWLHKTRPEADAFSRKKGFTVPVGRWITQADKALPELMARQDAIRAVANPDAVKALFSKNLESKNEKRLSRAAWVLLFYALWSKHHSEGANIAGASVYEALEQ